MIELIVTYAIFALLVFLALTVPFIRRVFSLRYEKSSKKTCVIASLKRVGVALLISLLWPLALLLLCVGGIFYKIDF